MLCVYILQMSGGTSYLKSTPNILRIIGRNLSHKKYILYFVSFYMSELRFELWPHS